MPDRTQKIIQALDALEKALDAFKCEMPALRQQIKGQLSLVEATSDYREKVMAAIDGVEASLKDYRVRFDEAMTDLERWEDESPNAARR